MKLVFILLLLVQATCLVQAQQVKKMSADELQQYITASNTPLVVSFWATWCASCNEELPYFIKTINTRYKDSVQLLLVSLDFKEAYPAKISAFAKKKNYQATLIWLNETNADLFCPKIHPRWEGSIPASLFINNKNGYRRFYERALTEQQFINELQELVK